jgi:hypothetical protein
MKGWSKIITDLVISHLLKHNVLKSLCEDRKDENRAIVKFQTRGNEGEGRIMLNKQNQRQKKLDEDQRNTVQPCGV